MTVSEIIRVLDKIDAITLRRVRLDWWPRRLWHMDELKELAARESRLRRELTNATAYDLKRAHKARERRNHRQEIKP